MLYHFDFLNVLAPYNPILAPDKFLSWTISNKNSLTSYYLVAFMFSYFIIYNDSSSLYFNSIPKIIINNFIKIFYFDNSSEEGNLNSNSPYKNIKKKKKKSDYVTELWLTTMLKLQYFPLIRSYKVAIIRS